MGEGVVCLTAFLFFSMSSPRLLITSLAISGGLGSGSDLPVEIVTVSHCAKSAVTPYLLLLWELRAARLGGERCWGPLAAQRERWLL